MRHRWIKATIETAANSCTLCHNIFSSHFLRGSQSWFRDESGEQHHFKHITNDFLFIHGIFKTSARLLSNSVSIIRTPVWCHWGTLMTKDKRTSNNPTIAARASGTINYFMTSCWTMLWKWLEWHQRNVTAGSMDHSCHTVVLLCRFDKKQSKNTFCLWLPEEKQSVELYQSRISKCSFRLF